MKKNKGIRVKLYDAAIATKGALENNGFVFAKEILINLTSINFTSINLTSLKPLFSKAPLVAKETPHKPFPYSLIIKP